MPNDLRDPKFHSAPRPAPRPAANPGGAGGLFTIVCSVFALLGVVMLIGGAGFFGIVWIAISVGLMVNGQKQFKQAEKKGRPANWTANRPSAAAAPRAPQRDQEPCPNPEPHRHYEQQKSCPNLEPHRHYEAAGSAASKSYTPKTYNLPAQDGQHDSFAQRDQRKQYGTFAQRDQRKQYDTFVQPVKRWPTDAERRLENMKNLYDAGLLTREEYDDEVRRLKRG